MAKSKASKSTRTVPNKHLHSRVAYLYEAATYLLSQKTGDITAQKTTTGETESPPIESDQVNESQSSKLKHKGLPNHLVEHIHSISRRGQIHLSPDVKRTFCKSCNTLLISGSTSSSRLENRSRGGKKPWADVLVVKCLSCGAEKRFPVGSERQKKKADRVTKDKSAENPEGKSSQMDVDH
ncbi:Rpr2-domain-containing protein [Rhizodiscina lignyota]|uniref:Rpr2-domain-containing protein n=1 Tax=Rhizodiscina lignyota TaxID=1504668 RepID=A0A9P4M862_9PEZI|nr:Rpr2-domain-containing protein [Rhizodiscina lignyota]